MCITYDKSFYQNTFWFPEQVNKSGGDCYFARPGSLYSVPSCFISFRFFSFSAKFGFWSSLLLRSHPLLRWVPPKLSSSIMYHPRPLKSPQQAVWPKKTRLDKDRQQTAFVWLRRETATPMSIGWNAVLVNKWLQHIDASSSLDLSGTQWSLFLQWLHLWYTHCSGHSPFRVTRQGISSEKK